MAGTDSTIHIWFQLTIQPNTNTV